MLTRHDFVAATKSEHDVRNKREYSVQLSVAFELARSSRLPKLAICIFQVVAALIDVREGLTAALPRQIMQKSPSHLGRSTLRVFSNETAVAQSLGFGHRQLH